MRTKATPAAFVREELYDAQMRFLEDSLRQCCKYRNTKRWDTTENSDINIQLIVQWQGHGSAVPCRKITSNQQLKRL